MRQLLRLIPPTVTILLLSQACTKPKQIIQPIRADTSPMAVRMGWAIQAGAFSQLDNAARLYENLSRQGLGATYFRDKDRLYKVRFGDFPDRDAARRRAETLRSQGVLDVFYLVAPESLSGAKIGDSKALSGVRKSLTATAESYLGVPYLWGGTSEAGFDCSGLSQAVYRLNGLSIPRTSREQFAKGRSVSRSQLRSGDLLFFATGKGNTVNHVAIYIENGVFIHAPKPGTVIRKDNLSNKVLSKQYIGAKSYL